MNTWYKYAKSVAILLALFLACSASSYAQDEIVVVCDGTGCDDYSAYPNQAADLQEAFALAQTNTSITTIWLTPGTWDVPPQVVPERIESIVGKTTTETFPNEITVSGAGSVLNVTGGSLELEGFAITGGTTGVKLAGGATVTVNRCYIHGNSVGVDVSGSASVTIQNTVLFSNSDAALKVSESGAQEDTLDIQAINCTLKDNGYAVSTNLAAKVDLYNCIIYWANAPASSGFDIDPGLVTLTAGYCDIYSADGTALTFPGTPEPSSSIMSVDPLFEDTPDWEGQLETSGYTAATPPPLVDRGGDKYSVNYDFEDELRAPWIVDISDRVSDYDIGADELRVSGGSVIYWEDCEVLSAPVIDTTHVPWYIGRGTVGSVTVTFTLDIGNNALTGLQAYILTAAAGNPSDGFDLNLAIPLTELQKVDGESYRYTATNTEAIETLYSPDGENDFFMDGPGYIVLFNGNDEVEYQKSDSRDQVLIDTVPPILTGYAWTSNDSFSANGCFTQANIGSAPSLDTRGNDTVPEYNGADAVKVFFNTSCLPPAADALELTITATFEDDRPAGPFPLSTELSGLPSFSGGLGTAAEVLYAAAEAGAPTWSTLGGAGALLDGGDGVNVSYNSMSESVTARWEFLGPEGYGFPPGRANSYFTARFVPPADRAGNVPTTSELGIPIQFWWLDGGETRLSPHYDCEVKRPSFSWNYFRSADPAVPKEDEAAPQFVFRLFATGDVLGGHKQGPYYPAVNVGVPEGPSWPGMASNGWSQWTTLRSLPYEWFDGEGGVIQQQYTNQWLLLVVLAVDEAGNVEEWPSYLPLNGNTITYVDPDLNQPNWERFMIPDPAQESLDTVVSPLFWEDSDLDGIPEDGDISYGAANALCWSSTLAARFRVGRRIPPGMVLEMGSVNWQLIMRTGDGRVYGLYPGEATWISHPSNTVPLDSDSQFTETITLDDPSQDWVSVDVSALRDQRFPKDLALFDFEQNGDIDDGNDIDLPVEITFRAWITGRVYREGETSPTIYSDVTSPAVFHFSILDCTKENRTVDSGQPIKRYKRGD